MSTIHEKAETLFHEALKFTPAERPAFVAGACGHDAALRRRLEALLKAEAEADGFLPESPQQAATMRLELSEASEEALGSRISHYKLLQKVGEGGCGVVYMAEQEEPVRRRVALKVIKLGMDTKSVVARFEAERQALAMMDHPNIAKVLDAGSTEKGRPFFVMELVRGIKITDYCDHHQLSTEARLELFITVCQAVQHAHQKGIIHRDLKPSNILVTLHDGVPVPKVIDFGIAKATDQKLTEKTLFTELHQFIGTPAYMSPEQAEMTGLDIDTRSDIYSLGVLLYELLTGRTPFDARALIKEGLDVIRRTIREVEPPRPSTSLSTLAAADLDTVARARGTAATHLRSQLTGDLDWIVMKAMEKDRTRRYETANGLAQDLRRHLTDEPVTARAPSAGYKFGKFARRNKVAFAVAATIAVVLVLATGVSLWQARQAMRAKRAADIAKTAEQQQRLLAENKRQESETQRLRAEASERGARRLLYAANMTLAQQAWEEGGGIGRLKELLAETKDDPSRGFEWYYWQQQIHQEARTLNGHYGNVHSLSFSPDGQRVVTAGEDSTARIWELSTGRELLAIKLNRNAPGTFSPNWAAYSPDGQRILTAGLHAPTRILDAITGRELLTLTGAPGGVGYTSGSFSPDGQRIATCEKGVIKIWDAISGRELRTFENTQGDGLISAAKFHPDGRHILAQIGNRYSKWSKVWDVTTGEERPTLILATNLVGALAFSPDGQRIATTGSRQEMTATIWDAATGRVLITLKGHRAPVHSVHFSPDGRRIVTASGGDGYSDISARVWDAATGRELFTLKGHVRNVMSAVFSPDGKWIATAGHDSAKLWDAINRREPITLSGTNAVNNVVFFADARRMVVNSTRDTSARLYDVATGQELRTFTKATGRVGNATLSPDGLHLLTSGGTNGVLTYWDVTTGRELLSVSTSIPFVQALAISPDGRRFVAGGNDDPRIKVWDATTGQELPTLPGHPVNGLTTKKGVRVPDGVMGAAFSPDGTRLVTCGMDFTAKVWDTATGRELLTLLGHDDALLGATYSPDGRRIVTGSYDFTARIWDADTGRELTALRGHSLMITHAAFSPDGQRVVTTSTEPTVRVWDAVTGRQLLTLQGRDNEIPGASSTPKVVLAAAFTPDGQRIITCGFDRKIYVHEAATKEQVAEWEKDK